MAVGDWAVVQSVHERAETPAGAGADGTLRDRPGVSLFVAFGLALLFTMGALVAFLIEMLLASCGLRDQANCANEVGEMHELAAEGVGEPTHGESG